MSKIDQPKINIEFLEKFDFQYKLTKPDVGGFVQLANKIGWIRWRDNGTFKELSPQIEIGTSLILEPQRFSFTWQTTPVTEIVEKTDNHIIFKTKNSLYKLEKI